MPREQGESPPASGSSIEFDDYYRSDHARLIGFAMRLGANIEEAQDAAQDAMTEVFKNWDRMNEPRAYARVVAERRFLRSRAKVARELESLERAGWASERPVNDPEYLILKQEGTWLVRTLQRLPYEQRRVMAWHLDGFSDKEIAVRVERPEATVRSNLRHAKNKLRELVDQDRNQTASAGRRADDEHPGR